MKEASFYHLTTSPLEKALPRLMERVVASGKRAVIFTPDDTKAEQVNHFMWTYSTNRFIPHGSKKDGYADEQPIYITGSDENPNNAEIAVVINGLEPELTKFSRLLDVFDGNSPEELEKARARWKKYKASGLQLSYFKQDDSGKWEQQDLAA